MMNFTLDQTKLTNIQKRANVLHQNLVRRMHVDSQHRIKNIYRAVERLDYGNVRQQQARYQNPFYEDTLQHYLTEWHDIDPQGTKGVLYRPKQVRQLIKDKTIVDVLLPDQVSDSDHGASDNVAISRENLKRGLPWYTVIDPFDDLTCKRATVPLPCQITRAIKISTEKHYHDVSPCKTLYRMVQLITKGHLLKGQDQHDAVIFTRYLFDYRGKRFTTSHLALHEATLHLDMLLERHHDTISNHPYGDQKVFTSRQMNPLALPQYAERSVQSAHGQVAPLAELIKCHPSAYWSIKKHKDYRTVSDPTAELIARIFLSVFGIKY